MSIEEVANELGKSEPTILRWMRRGNVERRKVGNKRPSKPWHDKETLKQMYHGEGLSTRQIGDHFDVEPETIRNQMKKYDIERRTAEEGVRERYKYDVTYAVNEDGYVIVQSAYEGDLDRFRLHRLLATIDYDLSELKGNVVHHKNGMKVDNRRENLVPLSREKHVLEHQDDLHGAAD